MCQAIRRGAVRAVKGLLVSKGSRAGLERGSGIELHPVWTWTPVDEARNNRFKRYLFLPDELKKPDCMWCGAYEDAQGCPARMREVEMGTLSDCWRPDGTMLVWEEVEK